MKIITLSSREEMENFVTDIISALIMKTSDTILRAVMLKNQDLATSVMNIPGSNPKYFHDKLNEFIISSLEDDEEAIDKAQETYVNPVHYITEQIEHLFPEVQVYALHLLKTYDREKGGEYTASLDTAE